MTTALFNTSRTDTPGRTATLFGHTAAMAWHNAQLYQELARRATTDGLTGLYNSRWLREAGELEIADSRRRGMPLSVVLVDLNRDNPHRQVRLTFLAG